MRRDKRIELYLGLGLYGLTMSLNYIFNLPEFIMGIMPGLTICFEVAGILPEKLYNNLKLRKKAIWQKIYKQP